MEVSKIQRGFSEAEFIGRMQRAQRLMHENNLDAILLTTQANIFYFTGFLTQFWKSPTRPWFVVLPSEGKPIAVIPGIGQSGMAQTWVEDIRTWDAPSPNDDGISLLTDTLKSCCQRYKKLGVPLGIESYIRIPYNNFQLLQNSLPQIEFIDVSVDIHKIRSIKSAAEIQKIKAACFITNNGFDQVASHARVDQTERQICKDLEINLLNFGGDSVEYLICGSGEGGYDSIIMGPLDNAIKKGDIVIFDTGVTFDGYYSDFCRNYGFGSVSESAKKANAVIHKSIDEAFKIARPGITTADLFNCMWNVLEIGGALGNDVGRMGHGLGCELTEWPSNMPNNAVTLEPGMVLTLEPGMYYADGKSLVHEEVIAITEDGAEWLSRRADPEIQIIDN